MSIAMLTSEKILIAGTCYVPDDGRVELTKLWARVVQHVNPDIDVVLVDSASPFNPRDFLPETINVVSFPDNIGALSQGARDGSGRAFCKALELAVEGGYDYCMIWEADMLFAPSVESVIDKMRRVGVKVACPYADPYQFPEWGCSFWSTQYLKETRFIERYGWENCPKWPIPEWRIKHMVEDELFILPIHGYRNSMNTMNMGNMTNLFPYSPPSFITHCLDFSLYYRFLDLNRIHLVEKAA